MTKAEMMMMPIDTAKPIWVRKASLDRAPGRARWHGHRATDAGHRSELLSRTLQGCRVELAERECDHDTARCQRYHRRTPTGERTEPLEGAPARGSPP